MKRCPSCDRTYTDDTQRFCLDDGALLLSVASGSSDPMAATLLDSPPPPRDTGSARSAPTEVFHATPTYGNQASQPSPSWPPSMPQPLAGSRDTGSQPGARAPFTSSTPTQGEKRKWPAFVTLVIGLITWLMLLLSFVGAGINIKSEVIGFLFLAGMMLGLVGAVLGLISIIVSIRLSDQYGGKGIAIVGLLMNLLPLLLMALLIAIGIAVS